MQAVIAYARELDYSAYGGFDSEVARQLAKAFHHRATVGDWPE